MLSYLIGLPRKSKQIIATTFDLAALMLAFSASVFAVSIPIPHQILLFTLITLGTLALLWTMGLYQAMTRFVAAHTLLAVITGTFSAAIIYFLTLSIAEESRAFQASIVFFSFASLLLGGARVFLRYILAASHGPVNRLKKRVIIYGAGSAGIQLATALGRGVEYLPVAFIDDAPSKRSLSIEDLTVYPSEAIADVITTYHAQKLLLAIPSASRQRRNEIVQSVESLAVEIQTMPGIADIVSGKARIDDIQNIKIEDILGRDPVQPDETLLKRNSWGKSVLVTGAGGSIGSELTRQIALLEPKRLVLLEQSEYALYTIEREIQALVQLEGDSSGLEIIAIMGSTTDKILLDRVMSRFSIETIYHAAAYKHVPLVEQNILAGVSNNIFGTLTLAEAAGQHGVSAFTLISTDKAVRPTSTMGATKRMAELVLQALNGVFPHTTFSIVRFGNVLGSSGSVVPLFKQQIASGGPISVTHPQITRYFMTIPEAACLVLQASSMATGGDIFLLDMGEPVRIVDLAKRMVRLSGLDLKDEDHPNGDIEIEFSGLRPGEKLFEELLINTENATNTSHPKVMKAAEKYLIWEKLQQYLAQLAQAIHTGDPEKAREILQAAPTDFRPTHQPVDNFSVLTFESTQTAVKQRA